MTNSAVIRTAGFAAIAIWKRRLRDVVLGLLVSGTVFASGLQAATSDWLIEPGDKIRLTVMGLPTSMVETVVKPDGSLDLVWLGTVMAEGKTTAELLDSVRQMTRGKVVKRYGQDGALNLIQLTEEDVFIELYEHRPVIVSGDVANPGEITFRPDLSPRQAIALAGGARSSLLAGVTTTDPIQILRWQSDYARAALENAAARVQLWRITAEVDDTPDPALPEKAKFAISGDILDELIAEQTRVLALNRKNDAGERAFLAESLAKARDRIAILEEQKTKQTELLEGDEAEEARVRDLLDRGLAPATRLADVRRTTVLTASQLLTIEANLATIELEIARLQRQLDKFEETRLAALLEQRDETYKKVLDTGLLMNLFNQNLSGSGTLQAGQNVSLTALRRSEGKSTVVDVDMDTPLLPGDTLIVSLARPTGLSNPLAARD